MNSNRDVKIEVRSRDEQLPDNLRDYAIDKAGRLDRFHGRISSIQIVVEEIRHAPTVEIIVHVDSGATFVAKEQNTSFRAAIDLLMSKIEKQLKKHKEKLTHHKGDAKSGGAPPPPSEDTGESYDDVVRKDLGGR